MICHTETWRKCYTTPKYTIQCGRDMRAKEFLQEKSVTKTGFNQIMADANNRLGFECEIIVLGDYTTVRDTDQMSWDEFSGYLSISNNELNRIKEENTKNFLKKKWYKKVAGADEYDEENEDGDTRSFLRWLHSDEAEVLRHHYTYDKMIEQYGGTMNLPLRKISSILSRDIAGTVATSLN